MTTRLKTMNPSTATPGYTPMRPAARQAATQGVPRRRKVHAAAVSAHAVIGQASYRVMHASAKVQPIASPVGAELARPATGSSAPATG